MDRLKKVIKEKYRTKTKFSEKFSISNSTLSDWTRKESERKFLLLLEKIISEHPEISRDWLYFGEGDMYAALPTPIIPEAAPIGGNIFELVDRLGGEELVAQAGGVSVKQLRAIMNGEEFPSAQTLTRWLASARLSANFVLANVGPIFVTDDMLLNSFARQEYLRETRLRDLRQEVARDLGMDNTAAHVDAEAEYQGLKKRIDELEYTIETQKKLIAAYERGNRGNINAPGMSSVARS